MERSVVSRNIKQIVQCFLVWYLLLHWTSPGVKAAELCSKQESVDITNGKTIETGLIEHQGVRYSPSQYFQDGNVTRGCICLVLQCIYICQTTNLTRDELTELYANVSDASGNSNRKVNLANNSRYHLIFDKTPCAGMWLQLEQEKVNINSNGQLQLRETLLDYPQFCILPKDDAGEFNAGYCEAETNDVSYTVYAVGFLVSLPFLVATFMVYAVLPVLQNLQGLLIMSYVASLAVSYLLLALGKLDTYENLSVMCGVCGYALYFTLMASFFWLNIISFDIYWTFGGSRGRASERRKYLYALYAWGVPLLLLLLTLLFDHTEVISYDIRPHIGEEGCFLKENKLTQFLYLYLPLLVVISANIYFFVITTKRMYQREQANVVMMKGNSRHLENCGKDRKRFGLYLRWFIVTSVAWSLEIISWLLTEPHTSPSWVIYLLDITNCLAGIVIFFLFIWNQRVKRLLLQRFNCVTSTSTHNLFSSHSMSSIVSSYAVEGNRVALTSTVFTDTIHGIMPKGESPPA